MITIITDPCDRSHLAHGMSPVATGSGGPSGLEDSPYTIARENGQRAESPDQERSSLHSGGRALERQTLPHARTRVPELLLSRISINLAAQSIGSMGALITSIMNPGNHAASCPIGSEPLGEITDTILRRL
ncbi:MAG TPA: hypothetical protein PK105_07975 [Rectinema sp.]|nr:hypothetical protein [Rectinema sp.]